MTSLLSTIDRLSTASAAINKSACAGIEASAPGPFYRALVTRDVQSVIRDVDETELGLFTLADVRPRAQQRGVNAGTAASSGSGGGKEDERGGGGGDDEIGSSKAKGKGKAIEVERDIEPQGVINVDRVSVVEATPLRERKRRVIGGRSKEGDVNEYDPEVYAEAALRFLARYQPVANMPRARAKAIQLLKRAEETRSQIEELQVTLQKNSEERSMSPKKQVQMEEKKVRELQTRVEELRRRKETLLEEQERLAQSQGEGEGLGSRSPPSFPSPAFGSSTRSRQRGIGTPSRSPFAPNIIPVPTKQALPRQTARRLSRLPVGPSMAAASKGRFGFGAGAGAAGYMSANQGDDEEKEGGGEMEDVAEEEEEESYGYEEKVYQEEGEEEEEPVNLEEGDEDLLAEEDVPEEEGDLTITAALGEGDELEPEDPGPDPDSTPSIPRSRKAGQTALGFGETPTKVTGVRMDVASAPTPATPRSMREGGEADETITATPVATPIAHGHKRSRSGSKGGIKITPEVELVATKIWQTMGETLFPGHAKGMSEGAGLPRGKETVNLLQRVLSLPPPPPSPSNQSISTLASVDSDILNRTSTPTQILSAHLILTVLNAPSMKEEAGLGGMTTSVSTKYAIPLQKLKEVVSEKLKKGSEEEDGRKELGEKDVTRALYGCVAKKLMAIDRGGGGQVVRFNL